VNHVFFLVGHIPHAKEDGFRHVFASNPGASARWPGLTISGKVRFLERSRVRCVVAVNTISLWSEYESR